MSGFCSAHKEHQPGCVQCAAVPPALGLLRSGAVTLCSSGSRLIIECNSPAEAALLHSWLEELAAPPFKA